MTIQHTNGNAAELYVASIYVKLGYNILWPMMTQTRYDFVAEKAGEYTRVQVKKASWSRNDYFNYLQARISSRNKGARPKYEKNEFEEFAFTDDSGRVWVIPFEKLEGNTSVCLDSDNPSYKGYSKKYNPKECLVWPKN